MSERELVQGSQEWREARAGRITGSRVGAVLGCSPYASRSAVLKEMVQESLGNFEGKDNIAMKWGRDNESKARAVYEFLYAGALTVETTGFWPVEMILGASPDGLVGDEGLVQIKCPFGLRDDATPVFKSIHDPDMKHYWHQIQLEMLAANREWCDFFQWTPHDNCCERVERDQAWLDDNMEEFKAFIADFEKALSDAVTGGPQDKLQQSAKWAAASEEYLLAKAASDKASEALKNAKDRLVGLCEAANVDVCAAAGVKVQKVSRKGSVDYKALAVDMADADDVKAIEENYRRSPSVSWKLDELKEEK